MDHVSNEQKGWRRFRRLKIEKGALKRRARKIENATVKHAHRFLTRRWTNMRDVGRHTTGWLVLVGLLIILATAQMTWFAAAYTKNAPTKGGTYAEGVIGQLDTMNPLFASSAAEVSASKLIFSGLLGYDRDSQLRPDVAASWSVSEDGKIYTVRLRDDVYWHDTVKLTADDVIFTVNLIQNPAVKAVQYGTLAGVTVEKVADNEVKFILPSVYAPFAQALTFGILPQHLLRDVAPADLRENDFGRKPVGSGPFVFEQLQIIDPTSRRLVVHMEANQKYHKATILLNRFQLHTYENRETLQKALVTSEINAALGLGAEQIQNLTERGGFVAATSPLLDSVFALFNNDQPLLQDAQVRQALVLGTDRQAIIAAVYNRATALNGPLPQGFVPGETTAQATFNVKDAEAKLEAAGWKLSDGKRQKNGTTLELSVVAPNGGDYKLVVEELAKQWRILGIQVKVQLADLETIASDYLRPRAYDVLLYELTVGSDADVYAYWHSSQINTKDGLNFANYRSGLANDALSSARSKLDPALRTAKYKTFYEQWIKDAPGVALYQPLLSYVTTGSSTSLETANPVADIAARYSNVERWSVLQSSVFTTR